MRSVQGLLERGPCFESVPAGTLYTYLQRVPRKTIVADVRNVMDGCRVVVYLKRRRRLPNGMSGRIETGHENFAHMRIVKRRGGRTAEATTFFYL
jgi:hypothetical protein